MSDMKKPSFEESIDTRLIYDHLRAAAAGEVVSHKALEQLVGRKLHAIRSNITTALRRLENEGILFGNIRGKGYQRLADAEIVKTGERERGILKRRAKRAVKRLACVQNFDGLPNDLKVKHNAEMSAFGAISTILKTGNMKRLEQAVEHAAQQLPLAKTLEAFRG